MKAITLTQPWATLVAIGAKKIETRSWRTQYRGPLAIHAAKGFPKFARQFTMQPIVYEAMRCLGASTRNWYPAYPLGAVLATCNLVDCLPMEPRICLPGVFDDYPELNTSQERAFGDFSPGRWAWILEDVKPLDKPIPAKGALSLWEWTPLEERAKQE